ncbi:MAG TPA: hypothetical protein PK280_13135 [Planctomycetota bacterium]|nr:hypothetical protein [Planctomycetota bacterium]
MAHGRRTSGRGGGIGGAIAGLVILALLAGVAYVVWWKLQQAKAPPPKPTGPKAVIEDWKSRHSLVGDIPEPLGQDWRFAFDKGPYWKSAANATPYPTSWVEIQLENGRFTALSIATYRESEAAPPMDLIYELAGETEGGQLRSYVRELGGMPNGSHLEKETAQYRFFGWRYRDDANPRRSMVCVAHKNGGPKTDELYARERANWEAMPKKPPEQPGKRPELKPAQKTPPAQDSPTATPAAETPKPPPAPEQPKTPPVKKPEELSPVERAL